MISPNYSVKLSLYVERQDIIPQNTHTRTHAHKPLRFTLDEYMLIN